MASIITATTTSGLTQSADNSGVLQLASGTGNLVTIPSVTGTAMVSGNIPAFLLTRSSSYGISNNTTVTKVTLDTAIYDNFSGFNSGTNTYTIPVTGRYFVEWSVSFTGFAANQVFLNAILYKNGSQFADFLQNNMTSNSSTYTGVGTGLVLNLTAGDTLSLYQNYAAGNLTINHDNYRTKLTGYYLG
jgi:hypothetical protein